MAEHKATEDIHVSRSVQINFQNEEDDSFPPFFLSLSFFLFWNTTQRLENKPLI